MNRVIKFRYRYTNGTNWIFQVFTLAEICNGMPFEVLSDNPLLKNYRYDGEDLFSSLTDKNGVEIYEGDVLVSTFGNGLPFVIKFGEYHDSSGDDDLATVIGFYILEQDGTESLFGKSVNGDTDCYQVIGNVFQNLSTNHL